MVTDRRTLLGRLQTGETFDLLVVGGGATGCGVALDAASRGLSVALVEGGDFASGTSGRSTKLIHGGVRYLEAALTRLDPVQYGLVRDGLYERAVLLRIAPHLCAGLSFLIPCYRWLDIPYLTCGVKLYDLLAGEGGLGPSRTVGRAEAQALAPTLARAGLKGGVVYRDGQFNDARMNLALAQTALGLGGALANHLRVEEFIRAGGRLTGARVRERFSGESWEIRARCLVNACGPSADGLRLLDDPQATPLLTVSSGVHIVLDRRFAPPEVGITIPKTEDGRVLFILPWQGHCLVGTTDEAAVPGEAPAATEAEIAYLLRHLNRYLDSRVERSDVRAAWSGLRPLLRDQGKSGTARLARDHLVEVSPSGLVTVVGGKWTTYRRMARDAVDCAIRTALLAPRGECQSDRIVLFGGERFAAGGGERLARRHGLPPEVARHLHESYGDRADEVAGLCRGALLERLAPGHPYLKGEVLYAVRREMAVSAADFLARRVPFALLDREAALTAAPEVIALMARELGWDGARVARERDSGLGV